MEKLLSKKDQQAYRPAFIPKKSGSESTAWDEICAEAEQTGDCIFLSAHYKKLPVRYKSKFILRRRELDNLPIDPADGISYKFCIQVARR
mgnify:CR=1 FL=1|jgi:hypothetical protein